MVERPLPVNFSDIEMKVLNLLNYKKKYLEMLHKEFQTNLKHVSKNDLKRKEINSFIDLS